MSLMVHAINSNASQLYSFFRTQQAAQPRNALQQAESAVADQAQGAQVTRAPSGASKPAAIAGDSFATLLQAQEAFVTKSTGNDSVSSSAPTAQSIGGAVDLDEYFSNDPKPTGPRNLLEGAEGLLLPSERNVKAIAAHADARFKELLTTYDIPEAPAQITYDHAGRMQLPADYAYKDELKQALEENPGLKNELSTLNALTGHAVALQRSMAFRQDYAQAPSQAQADAVIAQYPDLFSDNNKGQRVSLTFSATGDLSLMANGKPMKFS
jgi:hypothetical protein